MWSSSALAGKTTRRVNAVPELRVGLVDVLLVPVCLDGENAIVDRDFDLMLGVDPWQLRPDGVVTIRDEVLHPHALSREWPEHRQW